MGKRVLHSALIPLTVLLILSSGCVGPLGPECVKPQIPYGGGCCLDENGDGACDEGTQTTGGVIAQASVVSTPPLECDAASMKPAAADYMILLPKMIFAGAESSVSMTAMSKSGSRPVKSCVELSLVDERSSKIIPLAKASTGGEGHAVASFRVPENVEPGVYSVVAAVAATGEKFKGSVTVKQNPALLIETDKPIYKPSQTIQGRVLTLDNNMRPVRRSVVVEILDAKGVKVFRRNLTSSEYGMASFSLPLASELNYGTWKIYAESGSSKTNVDVRVERYVLPKFKVDLTLPKEWYLVSEEIKGVANSEYFFGKKVEGELKIDAYKYVGEWVKYETYTADLKDGSADFTLPPVEYVAGTPGAGGQGSLLLNVTVTDTGGHSEGTSKLLKIVQSPVVLQLIPESPSVKPGLPFQIIVVTETPDGKPLSTKVNVTVTFKNLDLENISHRFEPAQTKNGLAIVEFKPPADTYAVEVHAEVAGLKEAEADVALQSVYSPTSTFIHLAQESRGTPKAGGNAQFKVYSTKGGRVYYDVVAAGRTVYSGSTKFVRNNDDLVITVPVTPQMAPEAKLVAYKINPDSEVSADSLPFKVEMSFPVNLKSDFSVGSASPGDRISVNFDAGGKSLIGVAIVDESVYALNEGRLNMQQVFSELEKRFMEPQAEAHPVYEHIYDFEATRTPRDVLKESGLQAIGSEKLVFPEAKEPDYGAYWKIGGWKLWRKGGVMMFEERAEMAGDVMFKNAVAASAAAPPAAGGEKLAEVQRVRQFFPETWLWNPGLMTDNGGKATVKLTVPDSITTWRLHAVSSSPGGLGMSESKLTVFQDFFVEPDLPYAVTRGEEFPVSILVYNYLNVPQTVHLEMGKSDWFDLLGDSKAEVVVQPNSVSSASFKIKPTKLGLKTVDVTARTTKRADAVKREVIVEPEGVAREAVDNGILKSGGPVQLDATLPDVIIPDSGKVLLSLTPSIVAQSISGVDNMLGMPYGCGEQNMLMFAPDVEIMRYLEATNQVNPEVQAKAELFMQTGYQRELTYRHRDGSFSAFGESDANGSLWLTTFVLHTFSNARDQIEIDESVLRQSADWIQGKQKADGSFEPFGFVIHSEMVGGMNDNYALTSFVVLALDEYGGARADVLSKSKKYLEDNMGSVKDDPYAMALGSLALLKLKSNRGDEAVEALLKLAKNDENGMYWGGDVDVVVKNEQFGRMIMPPKPSGKSVENTAYAALALMEARRAEANKAVSWIVSQRNSLGGYQSTQDTVLAFRALVATAKGMKRDIAGTVKVQADGKKAGEFKVSPENFDVLQVLELPAGTKKVSLSMDGKGEVNYQLVRKFNVPVNMTIQLKPDIELSVKYDAEHVAVNDIVDVDISVKYVGLGNSTGMMIVDVAVPTGFEPVQESLDELKAKEKLIPRTEVAGRKIIVYVDNLKRGQELKFSLQVMARFPVKAIIPASKAYAYYEPDVKTEVEGGRIEVA